MNQTNFSIEWFCDNFHLDNQEEYTNTINYGDEVVFKYIDLDKLDLANCNYIYGVKVQDIFKFNIALIIAKALEYFPQLSSAMHFDMPNYNELSIKQCEHALTHNVYVRFGYNNSYYDCGYDIIESKSFDDEGNSIYGEQEQRKFRDSVINLDYYKQFDVECGKYKSYIESCTYELLIILSCVSDDKRKLATIIFANIVKNEKDFRQQIQLFKKIIKERQEKKINFDDFYDYVMPTNPDTGDDMTKKQFIKYIEKNVIKSQIEFIDAKYISIRTFNCIVMRISTNVSPCIENYKTIFPVAFEMVDDASDLIIKLVKQINVTKKYMPQYINDLFLNDFKNLKVYEENFKLNCLAK